MGGFQLPPGWIVVDEGKKDAGKPSPSPSSRSSPDSHGGFTLPPGWKVVDEPQTPNWSGENYKAPVRGIAKGLYNTFAGATRVLAPIPAAVGLGEVFPPLRDAPVEKNESTGYKVGQVLPYLAPGGPARGLGGAVVQGAKAGAVATAQGQDPTVPAVVGAAIPIVGPAVGKVAGAVARNVKPIDALSALRVVSKAASADFGGALKQTAQLAMQIGTRSKTLQTILEKGETRIFDTIIRAADRFDARRVANEVLKAAEKHPEIAQAVNVADDTLMARAISNTSDVVGAAKPFVRSETPTYRATSDIARANAPGLRPAKVQTFPVRTVPKSELAKADANPHYVPREETIANVEAVSESGAYAQLQALIRQGKVPRDAALAAPGSTTFIEAEVISAAKPYAGRRGFIDEWGTAPPPNVPLPPPPATPPVASSQGFPPIFPNPGESRLPTIFTKPKGPPLDKPLTAKERAIRLDQVKAAEEAGVDLFEAFGMAKTGKAAGGTMLGPGGTKLIQVVGPKGDRIVIAAKKGAKGGSDFNPLIEAKASKYELQPDKITRRVGTDAWRKALEEAGFTADEAIGFAHFRQGAELSPGMVYVMPELQRQGIATAMYDAARAATGLGIKRNAWGTRPQGRAFRDAYDARRPK